MRAFVLSGGASLGAIQAGMVAALYERRIAPDLIGGTSVGALNGAFIASRPATPQTAAALGDVWRSLQRKAPISHALELGAEKVYVLPTGYPCSLQKPSQGALEFLDDAPRGGVPLSMNVERLRPHEHAAR